LAAAAMAKSVCFDAVLVSSLLDSIEVFLTKSGARGADDLAQHLEQKKTPDRGA
jgi:hypothetical protein